MISPAFHFPALECVCTYVCGKIRFPPSRNLHSSAYSEKFANFCWCELWQLFLFLHLPVAHAVYAFPKEELLALASQVWMYISSHCFALDKCGWELRVWREVNFFRADFFFISLKSPLKFLSGLGKSEPSWSTTLRLFARSVLLGSSSAGRASNYSERAPYTSKK